MVVCCSLFLPLQKYIITAMKTLLTSMFIACSLNLSAQSTPVPVVTQKPNGRWSLQVDGQPYMVLGGQAHNSSTWAKTMPQLWDAVQAMGANTLEIPIYWEMIEPQNGQFDFSSVQMLLDQARQHKTRLILLWFATWKNGSNHYMPEWMKRESKRFPNVTGKNGKPIDSPSPHTEEAMKLDAAAFAKVMGYLKDNDPQHTVIMVQVENEPGAWDTVRDYSPKAEKIFSSAVPQELMTDALLQELGGVKKQKGTWKDVFGERADEYFHAWHVAKYIDYVAAAGKEVNPLPLYTNAALRNPLTNPMANEYESGGPTDNVICIYRTAAPHLDFVAPDIYLTGHETVTKILDLYARPDNALMVPEAGYANVKYLYKAIEQGMGFAPFGIDNPDNTDVLDKNVEIGKDYRLLAPLATDLAKWSAEGKIRAVAENDSHDNQSLDLGDWEAIIKFEQKTGNGRAMIVSLDKDEFLLISRDCRFNVQGKGKNAGKAWQYLKVEEGEYKNGSFHADRVLNGDETDWGGPKVGNDPKMLHITLVAR